MKVFKVIGWIFIPYIMIFIFWNRLSKILRTLAALWSVILLCYMILNHIDSQFVYKYL